MKFVIVFLLLMSMTWCGPGSCGEIHSKKQIIKLVQNNQAFLMQCIEEDEPEKATELRGIQSVSRDRFSPVIEFYCGGTGLVPNTGYYGFYYSPDDRPDTLRFPAREDLIEQGDGFGYQEPDGDNWYYTERIIENWYYYEEHY